MRIAFIAGHWPPERGANGVVTAIARLRPALDRLGCETKIVALAGARDEPDDRVVYLSDHPPPREPGPVRFIRNRIAPQRATLDAPPLQIARALANSPRLSGIDLIEMEESFGWAGALARASSVPLVVRLHGPYFLTGAMQSGAPFNAFERERIAREGAGVAAAAAISAPSAFVLESFRRQYGLALAGGRVIPNPAPDPDPTHRWNLSACDPNEILFIGRFDRIKGADIALRAFGLLAAKRPELRLIFAGPDGEALVEAGRAFTPQQYLAHVMSPEAGARVRFMGRVPPAELSRLRARAAVTIAPSRIEMFSNVLLEALAAGVPMIATHVGGNPEIIRDGIDGLLVEPEDPGALARAIEQALDAPDRAADLAAAGLRRAASEFSAEKLALRFLDFYAEALARRRGPAPQTSARR